jgi:hydrogenase maturation protease
VSEAGSLLILGLGNVLCGDDGLGVAAVTEIRRRYSIPEGVQVLDGGTLGLSLLSYFDADQDVILVDAITTEQDAGSFVRLEGDDVAPAVRNSLSVHQIGVADLIDSLRLIDVYPRNLILLGLVPQTLELWLQMSEPVETMMPFLLDKTIEEARHLGYELEPKKEIDLAMAGPDGTATNILGLS